MKTNPLSATLLLAAAFGSAAAAPSCQVTTGAKAPVVVELYTSEGCSSCPPADRWLSTLKGRDDVVALAFHVNYWDHLGWTDRFATPENTARQHALARWTKADSVYTPQIVVNGRDSPSAALPAAAPSAIRVTLTREGELVSAQVAAAGAAPARLDGYWAVLEDNHTSRVRAGENRGETLKHDHVVRLYRPLPAWQAADGTRSQLRVSAGEAAHPRRFAFVVTDALTHRPLQAAVLAC
jgi:hypothetical protein